MNETDRKELVTYRINRAKSTLREVKVLIANQLWNTAVNRLYYAVSALLVKNKIMAQTHSGVRQMFGQHFIKTGVIDKELGKFYSYIFNKRQTGDYDDFVDYASEDVESLVKPTTELVNEIERLII